MTAAVQRRLLCYPDQEGLSISASPSSSRNFSSFCLSSSPDITEMKYFTFVLLVAAVIAVVGANMFGAGGAFKKKFPGAKPMSYKEYMQIQEQRRKQAQQPPRPSNWMFDTPAQVAHSQRTRQSVVSRPSPVISWLSRSPGHSSESDYSREDD